MYGYDVSRRDMPDLVKLNARQLAALRDFILERLAAPGSVDKDKLKADIIAEIANLLGSSPSP
jgi:hypothetical protein